MGKSVKRIVAVTALTIGMGAFASGFRCAGEGYTVKMFNHISPEEGTRTPAALIIASEEEGTLLVRKGSEIRKNNRRNTVQYVVRGNRRLGADRAILQVAFKEGRETLEDGETVDGQLILQADEDREVVKLSCERYLKSE